MSFVTFSAGGSCPLCFNPNYTILVTEAQGMLASTLPYLHCENCQRNFATTGYTYSVPSGTAGASIVSGIVTMAGTSSAKLTSASTSGSVISLSTTAKVLVSVQNTGPALSIYPQFFDEGASPAGLQTDCVFGDGTTIVLGAGEIISFNLPLSNGLAYKLSDALPATSNLIIVWS